MGENPLLENNRLPQENPDAEVGEDGVFQQDEVEAVNYIETEETQPDQGADIDELATLGTVAVGDGPIVDKSMAEDMAIAEHYDQSAAASFKALANRKEASDDPYPMSEDELTGDDKLLKVIVHNSQPRVVGKLRHARPELLKDVARVYEGRAQRCGEWARIIHERPLSEEFKERWSEYWLEANHLADLDETSQKLIILADTVEVQAKALSGADINEGVKIKVEYPDDADFLDNLAKHPMAEMVHTSYYRTGMDNLISEAGYLRAQQAIQTSELEPDIHQSREMSDDQSQALRAQLQALKDNPDTKLGQLSDFYCMLIDEVYIQKWRKRAQGIKSLLDDIKSGRASEATS